MRISARTLRIVCFSAHGRCMTRFGGGDSACTAKPGTVGYWETVRPRSRKTPRTEGLVALVDEVTMGQGGVPIGT